MEFVQKHKIYDQFIDNNFQSVDWEYVSRYAILSDKQILKYARFLKMNEVCKYQKVSIAVAKKLVNIVNIDTLAKYQEHLSIAEIFKLKVLASIK